MTSGSRGETAIDGLHGSGTGTGTTTTPVFGPTLLTSPADVSRKSTHPYSPPPTAIRLERKKWHNSVSIIAMEWPGLYYVCNRSSCNKPVNSGGHRMSCFIGDRINVVVKALLPMPWQEKIERPCLQTQHITRCRVALFGS